MTTNKSTSIEASDSEKLIWKTINSQPDDHFSTISYCFQLKDEVTFEKIQKTIYLVLSKYAPELNYRFYENQNGLLLKKLFSPPSMPIEKLPVDKSLDKPIYNSPLIPLYNFYWRQKDKKNELIVHLSHLIYDGSCYHQLCKALEDAYEQKTISLDPQPRAETDNINSKKYWSELLTGKNLSQDLPFFLGKQQQNLITTEIKINRKLAQKIHQFLNQNSYTYFQFFASALSLLIHLYINHDKSKTALSLSYFVNKNSRSNKIGCHTNLLPLFVTVEKNDNFFNILENIKSLRASQRPHQNYDISSLIRDNISLNTGNNFNININESYGLIPLHAPKFSTKVHPIHNHSHRKDLTLLYSQSDKKLVARFESNAGDYFTELLNQLSYNFSKLLETITIKPDIPAFMVNLSEDRTPVSTGLEFLETPKPLIIYFKSQAEINAKKTAIIDSNGRLTYGKLFKQVNKLSTAILQTTNNKPISSIIVCLSRSHFLPISLLSCINLEVSFTPISHTTPKNLIKLILDSQKSNLILIDEETESLFDELDSSTKKLNVLEALSRKTTPTEEPIRQNLIKNEIAYTIYTSGTTGTPKGVKISYHALLNFFNSMELSPGITDTDILLAVSPISFDISINELLLPLFSGATVYICSDNATKDGLQLANIIKEKQISLIQATPATLILLKQTNWEPSNNVRFWIGGEQLPQSLASYFLKKSCEIYNLYGPTEATIWVASNKVILNNPITIGNPTNNTSLYVIDKNGYSVPLGMPGELLIKGKQIALGYSNYDNTPFLTETNGSHSYRTGDKVIALSKNNILFLERMDEQVKIHGHRIEPLEIDSVIQKIAPDIFTVTVVRKIPNLHLCTFYTTDALIDFNAEALLKKLERHLPKYKIPQNLVKLNSFPLSKNGKIDKRQLENLPSNKLDYHFKKKSIKKSQNINDRLRGLIFDHFDIYISDDNQSLLEYGFNSISLSSLSTVIFNHLNTLIQPHKFYEKNTLNLISSFLKQNSPNNKQKNEHKSTEHTKTPLAIIGYDAIMPGNLDPETFWSMLLNNKSFITTSNRSYISEHSKAGFLEHIDKFDRKFFKLSPLEVKLMDPRQRLLLQCAYKTLEHAGYPLNKSSNNIACFISATGNDYLTAQINKNTPVKAYTLSGNASNMLANRLSYYFNWNGPSVLIDTACSGSLAALARAAESLWLNNSSACFVGAANIIADSHLSDSLSSGGFLSPTNECNAFSVHANGYVRGEGVIGFLVKKLSDAEKDGDHIHAVIESIAENHGGKAASLTAPSQAGQAALLKSAYNNRLSEKISYIESHGTGTQLGDPIEMDALLEFEKSNLINNKNEKIYIGALKSNIGHLEAAAGFASMLKVIFCMRDNIIPSNINGTPINPAINLNDSKFSFPTSNIKWSPKTKQVAGISSFGFGGSNAHVVLSKYQNKIKYEPHNNKIESQLFVISAASRNALFSRIKNLITDLNQLQSNIDIADIAFTLAQCREHMQHRAAYIASSIADLKQQLLATIDKNEIIPAKYTNNSLGNYYYPFLNDEPYNFNKLYPNNLHKKIPLTAYSFDQESFWFSEDYTTKEESTNDLYRNISIDKKTNNTFLISLNHDHIFFEEHRVFGRAVLPAVAQLELIIKAINKESNINSLSFDNTYWINPIFSENNKQTKLTLHLSQHENETKFKLLSENNTIHSQGSIKPLNQTSKEQYTPTLKTSTSLKYQKHYIYEVFKDSGIQYGPYFQGINKLLLQSNETKAEITINPENSIVGLLDTAFQASMAESINNLSAGLMPFSLGEVNFIALEALYKTKKAIVYTKKLSQFRANILVCDTKDTPLLSIRDLGVKSFS